MFGIVRLWLVIIRRDGRKHSSVTCGIMASDHAPINKLLKIKDHIFLESSFKLQTSNNIFYSVIA
jgi:hypothetical protein